MEKKCYFHPCWCAGKYYPQRIRFLRAAQGLGSYTHGMGAAWALLCSESGSRGGGQRGVSLLCCCRKGQGGPRECGRVVPAACPFSCFRALSWIVSRMSPDASGGWLCRGDIPERQRGWGCAWSCASLWRCPACSMP